MWTCACWTLIWILLCGMSEPWALAEQTGGAGRRGRSPMDTVQSEVIQSPCGTLEAAFFLFSGRDVLTMCVFGCPVAEKNTHTHTEGWVTGSNTWSGLWVYHRGLMFYQRRGPLPWLSDTDGEKAPKTFCEADSLQLLLHDVVSRVRAVPDGSRALQTGVSPSLCFVYSCFQIKPEWI